MLPIPSGGVQRASAPFGAVALRPEKEQQERGPIVLHLLGEDVCQVRNGMKTIVLVEETYERHDLLEGAQVAGIVRFESARIDDGTEVLQCDGSFVYLDLPLAATNAEKVVEALAASSACKATKSTYNHAMSSYSGKENSSPSAETSVNCSLSSS